MNGSRATQTSDGPGYDAFLRTVDLMQNSSESNIYVKSEINLKIVSEYECMRRSFAT